MDGGMRLWRYYGQRYRIRAGRTFDPGIFSLQESETFVQAITFGVYRGGKVWVSVSHHEALWPCYSGRTRHVVSVRSSHHFTRLKLQYRSQMQRFLTNVGCKLRMGPYSHTRSIQKLCTRGFLRVHHQIDYLRCQTDFIILIVDNRSINLNLALGPIPCSWLCFCKSRKCVNPVS
jgi:hypothetical protein